jgi:hypothetical protein
VFILFTRNIHSRAGASVCHHHGYIIQNNLSSDDHTTILFFLNPNISIGPVSQGDITPVLKATRDAVTDIMRGVLAKVTQFSKNSSAETEHDRKNHNSNSNSSSSSHNGHSNGHNNSNSYNGIDNHNSSSNSDDVILQLNKEKNALERRVRLLEEENERSVTLAYKMESALSSSSSSVSGDTIRASYPPCSPYLLLNSLFLPSFLSSFPS